MKKVLTPLITYHYETIWFTDNVGIFAFMLHAQEQPRANNKMKAGLRGAVAYSNMYGSKNYHSQPTGIGFSLGREEYLLGYSAGGWISNQITKTISIVGELNITRKGMTTPIVGVYNGSKYEITLEPQLTSLCTFFGSVQSCKIKQTRSLCRI